MEELKNVLEYEKVKEASEKSLQKIEKFCFLANRKYSEEFNPIIIFALNKNDAIAKAFQYFGDNSFAIYTLCEVGPHDLKCVCRPV